MKFNNEDDDEEREDFFDGPDLPDEPEKKKRPVYKPADPRYWEEPESQWEHLRPRRPSAMTRLWIFVSLIAVALFIGIWLRYLSPCVDNATQYGYIDRIERRGTVFKTWEGVMIPYKEIRDTSRIYRRDFIFTAANNRIGQMLRDLARTGRPIRVEYRQYHATLPWRGSSKTIVTKVDTVDPRNILPPDVNPEK